MLAVNGDMGWDHCEVRWKASMVSLWNRLLGLPTNRVDNEIFYWDLSVGGQWATDISDILEECGLEDNSLQKAKVDVEEFKYQVRAKCRQSWSEEIW